MSNASKSKSKKIAPPTKPLGQRIRDSLQGAVDVLQSGRKLSDVYRMDTIEIPDPPRYRASDVKRLREHLGVTQRIFARVVGVSAELVEHWEQGVCEPRPMARRLLGAIERDPTAFFKRVAVRA